MCGVFPPPARQLDVVKGRGGALLREKMVEMASKKFVCIVDDTKLVSGLGGTREISAVEREPSFRPFFLRGCAPLLTGRPRFPAFLALPFPLAACSGSKLAMPVEIVQFCHLYTLKRLQALPEVKGCEAKLRTLADGKVSSLR